MSFELTANTISLLEKGIIEPNIVLTIDGIDSFFGARVVKHYARYGNDNIYYGMPGLVYGGVIEIEGQKDLISLSGTSDSFNQQLEPDKGAVQSSGTLVIRLIDTNLEITNLITPNSLYNNWDILYKNAQVFTGLANSSYPQDYIEIFNGKIMSITTGPGYVDFNITHPEDLKRSDIFIKAETKLTQDVSYYSLKFADILFQQLADVVGIVSIQILGGASGDVANVSVSGNTISIQVDESLTSYKTLKKKIMNHEDANQLVYVTIPKNGNGNNFVDTLPLTPLEVSTEIEVEKISEFFESYGDGLFQAYIKINDEIIRYDWIDFTNNKFMGCSRVQFETIGALHVIGDTVESFYKLGDGTSLYGNGIDLCLMILLSGGEYYYATNVDAENFVRIDSTLDIQNSIYFRKIDAKRKYGLTIGDYVTSVGCLNSANNFSERKITGFGITEQGSYIIVDGGPLVVELDSPGLLSFRTKYDILPDGVGLNPTGVDVEGFELVKSYFYSSIANYEFYLKDTISVKTFINEQILLPSAMYSVPRKGKISVKYTAPPLYDPNISIFNFDSVKNPSKLSPIRSVNNNFYNGILYKFNEDSLGSDLLNGIATLSASSTNRIDAPNKTLKINARGVRDSADNRVIIQRNSNALLKRYQFAAESFELGVPLKIGMNVEVGDVIVFGGNDFKMVDITTGTRNYKERLFEVINRSYNWKTGDLSFSITDTSYSSELRYAVFSPTSTIQSATSNQLIVKNSYGTLSTVGASEGDKWKKLIGKDVMVHNQDYSVIMYSKLISVDLANPFLLTFEPSFSTIPSENWELDIAKYDNVDAQDGLLKSIYLYWTPTLTVTGSISTTKFIVSVIDSAYLFIGSLIKIHDETYTIDSGNDFSKVTDITGTTITIEPALNFIPSSGQKIEAVGFVSDNGKPYVWL